ncbi:Hexaprenyldihydroxybenzoate methyltransferase, mitochondrial [Sorochytrium milnesiophthora]
MAEQWWNVKGEFAMLHRMNPVRVGYVRERACLHLGVDALSPEPLRGLRVLDIGCGGGLLTESLARLGGTVVGADASEENIKMAAAHAQADRQLSQRMQDGTLQYIHTTAEQLQADGQQFDVVCALEIIEHVASPSHFVDACVGMLKPKGLFFVSTMNRTPLSGLLTIVLAEHVLRLVSPGTHDYHKYIQPHELRRMMHDSGAQTLDVEGMSFSPFSMQWRLGAPVGGEAGMVNYIACAQRK